MSDQSEDKYELDWQMGARKITPLPPGKWTREDLCRTLAADIRHYVEQGTMGKLETEYLPKFWEQHGLVNKPYDLARLEWVVARNIAEQMLDHLGGLLGSVLLTIDTDSTDADATWLRRLRDVYSAMQTFAHRVETTRAVREHLRTEGIK